MNIYIYIHIDDMAARDAMPPAYVYSEKEDAPSLSLRDLLLPGFLATRFSYFPASSLQVYFIISYCCINLPPFSLPRRSHGDYALGCRRVNQKNVPPFARAGHTSRTPRLASAIFGRARASDRRAPGSPLGGASRIAQCWSCVRRVCVSIAIGRAKSHPRLPVGRA